MEPMEQPEPEVMQMGNRRPGLRFNRGRVPTQGGSIPGGGGDAQGTIIVDTTTGIIQVDLTTGIIQVEL